MFLRSSITAALLMSTMLTAPADRPGGKNNPRQPVSVFQPLETEHKRAVDAVEDYRTVCEGLGNLTDERIVEVVAGVPGRGDAIENLRSVALTEANAEEAEGDGDDTNIGAADPTKSEMMDIGALFPKELDAVFVETADKKEDVDGAPLMIAAFIDKTPALKAKMDNPLLPIPGTRHDAKPGEKLHPGYLPHPSNEEREPDIYKHPGITKDVTGSAFADIFAGTKPGIFINSIRQLLGRRVKNESLGSDQALWETLPKECSWEALATDKKRKAAIQRWNNRFNNSVGRLRTAQLFRLNRAKVNAIGHIKVFMVDNDLTVAANKKSPILLQYQMPDEQAETSDPKSIGTFNRMDVDAAIEAARVKGKPVTLADLDETVKRSPKTEAKTGIPTVPTAAQVPLLLNALANYFDRKADGYTKRMADFVAALNAAGSDEAVEVNGDVYHTLGEYFGKGMPFAKRYDNVKQARVASEETKAAA